MGDISIEGFMEGIKRDCVEAICIGIDKDGEAIYAATFGDIKTLLEKGREFVSELEQMQEMGYTFLPLQNNDEEE